VSNYQYGSLLLHGPRGVLVKSKSAEGGIVRSLPLLREIDQIPNGTEASITWLLNKGIITFPERCIQCEVGVYVWKIR
jgi:hypothetical protein